MTREALVLLVALAADAAFGDPPSRWHPVAWCGRVIGWGQRRWAHGSRARLRLWGAILVVGLAVAAGIVAWTLDSLTARFGFAAVLVQGLILKTTLSVRVLVARALEVAAHLEDGGLAAARVAVGHHLVSRPTGELDHGHVASAAIESVAENLTDSLVAPLAFFLAFGLPGAVAYRVVNTADAMLGYREGVLEDFGKVAARFDDALNFIPARLAAVILALSACVVGQTGPAFRVMWRDHARTASPNAGWTMAAMAGALGVTLEKLGAYRLGGGSLPTTRDISRSVKIFYTASGLTTLLAVLVILLAAGLQRGGTN